MTFDWNHAKTLIAVADKGSLTAAAKALGQTQPTVGRQISALEEALDTTLLEQVGRSVVLTAAGRELVEHARIMLAGADLIALAASGQSQSFEGQVRVTAPDVTSAFLLPSVLERIRDLAPDLDIDLVADNEIKDLVRREADIAIRHARPEQPNLVAKRLRDTTMRFYATDAYLERHGEPRKDDLAGHQLMSFVGVERMLGYLLPLGLDLSKENFRFTTTSQIVAWELARRGFGMMIMNEAVAAVSDEFRPVLTELDAFTIPTWLVAHRELKTSARVRFVWDQLVDALH